MGREIVGYLKQFGADVPPATYFFDSDVQHTVAPPPFWHLSEETLLQLIALAVQPLLHLETFRDHPANRDIPGNRMFRRFPRTQAGTHDADEIISQVGRLTKRPSESKRLQRLPSSLPTSKVLPSDEKKSFPNDDQKTLDDILNCFTPRLREITEEQNSEYGLDTSSRALTPIVGH